MKFKKLISLATTFVVTTSLLVGCSGNDNTEKADNSEKTIAIVLGEGSINDQSFNQATYEGLQKAEEEFGVKIKFLESKQTSEYIQNIETFIDEEADLIIGVGFQLTEPIKEMAETYPEQKFALLDASYDEIPANVTPVVFKEQEGAFLAGYLASKVSESKKVGFIGGIEASPAVVRYQYGFTSGAEYADNTVEVKSQYANTFTDQAKGKAIANQMYSGGVDTILSAAGDTGSGAIEAAKENNKKAIGVDRDQSYMAPENVITSAVKRLDVASYDLAKALVEDKLEGGKELVYGLKEGAVGLADNTKDNVSQEILDEIEVVKEKIINGEIKVPTTKAEYDSMK